MENKINIAELLKDCPEGMELDCTTWENVTLEKVVGEAIYIKRNNKGPSFDKIVILNKYGCTTGHQDEKCRIFPKDKTTWEGFVPPIEFKDGDVVAVTMKPEGTWIGIFKQHKETSFESYCCLSTIGEFNSKGLKNHSFIGLHFATEEEKQKLFDAIKANGYCWDVETKTLEKLIEPKFKVGDRIRKKGDYISGYITIIDIDNFYKVEYDKGGVSYVNVEAQDGWELAPDKFDINTLVPFESRVLVRNVGAWEPAFWGYYSKEYAHPFVVAGGNTFAQCIPYEHNEHLVGTTNDCDDFFKTWEK